HWTVQGQQAVANLTINVIDLEAGKPDAPTVTRTRFSEQSNPALDVTWTAPAANGLTISWYEVQYRKQGVESWTRYTGHVIETTSLRLPNLEAGATYEFQVRAGTNEEGVGPWSDTGSGRANRPPHHAAFHGGTTYYFLVNNNQPVGELWVGWPIEIYFADPDGDSLSWAVSSQYPGIGDVGEFQSKGRPPEYPFLTDEMTLRWTFLFYNPGTLDLTYGVHDGYGGYTHRKFSWTGKQAEARDIAENSPAGTKVGDPVTGTPYDDGDDETDDALTYTLTGEAATSGAFVIDSATGQISVQEDANLDYETKSSYTGQVNWTVQGQAVAADLTINVTDVEATLADAPTVTRTEFSEPSNPALDVTWTAADANGLTITGYEAQYRVQVAEGETANAWTAYSGTLGATATSLTLTDLDAGATYEVQVRAVTSEEGEGPWSDTGEGRANRPPNLTSVFLLEHTFELGEDATTDLLNGHGNGRYFQDADGDTLTFSASSEYPGLIRVTVVGIEMKPDFLNPGSSVITYGAHDAYGGYVFRTVTGHVRGDMTRSVAENSGAGTAVGGPVTGTPYDDGDDQTDDALSYSLTGAASTSGAFEINSATGQISVKQGATIDYETRTSYTGKVGYTVDGYATAINVTINVTDVTGPEAPAAPTVAAGATTPATTLDVDWTAPDDLGSPITGYRVQYRAAGPNEWSAHAFSGTGTETTITGLTSASIYEVQVLAVNAEGESDWSATGTGVTGPRQVNVQRSLPENAEPGTLVGDPVAVTAPESVTLSYAVDPSVTEAGGDDGGDASETDGTSKFVVDSASGQIRLARGASLDYETARSHSLTVQATYSVTGYDGRIVNTLINVVIDVTDVDESNPTPPPPVTPIPELTLESGAREVAENSPGGTHVGAAVAAQGG
ncbi:MAG: hypothetical protein F4Z29_12135, partial [Gemmatimonadetes bacterium]|nr:hypothetical protein [Gemmatimonadota bacterium]